MKTKTKKTAKIDAKFDFKTIKTFEDACTKLALDPTQLPDVSMIPEEFRKPIINAYKLMIIYKAINDGWVPDWNDSDQYKYYPYFRVLSSGFGFSYSGYFYTYATTIVGSRLCFESSEQAKYAGTQFTAEYKQFLL